MVLQMVLPMVLQMVLVWMMEIIEVHDEAPAGSREGLKVGLSHRANPRLL